MAFPSCRPCACSTQTSNSVNATDVCVCNHTHDMSTGQLDLCSHMHCNDKLTTTETEYPQSYRHITSTRHSSTGPSVVSDSTSSAEFTCKLAVCMAAFTMTCILVMGIRVRVIVNRNLHVFQWQPFTLIQVQYKFDFHSYRLFLCMSCF